MSKKEILTIGILAHVDAGKTSLTESLLFRAGATKARGSVDKGSAITDSLTIEKNRGISIKTATVDFEWKGKHIFLVDTPGHIDFAAEVDRVLGILDMIILVVSAKDGVQAHTLNLWSGIRERNLPVLFFVNKTDLSGVDPDLLFSDLEKDLDTKLFALNYAVSNGGDTAEIISFKDIKPFVSTPVIERSFENLAECDEAFLQDYLEDKINDTGAVLKKAEKQIQAQKLVGVIFGSAKLDLGIEDLLDKVAGLFQARRELFHTPSARVFKVELDPKLGRLIHIRSYGSKLQSKDVIWSQFLQDSVKINQIYQRSMGNVVQKGELAAGELGIITSSHLIQVGDVLGPESLPDEFDKIGEAVLSVQAIPVEEKDHQKLGEALEILYMEDPQLDFVWYKEEHEFHLKILGPIQTEVLQDSLASRFGLAVTFLPPKIIYKETPKTAAKGFVKYWMPKPCWAIMTFLVEPGSAGSGINFISKVRTSDISVKYQNEVKRAIPWSLKQGIKGWEVTDIKITLLEGEAHTMHSNPGDFLLATPMGIMRGLELADTDLLEPMYSFQIKANQSLLGAISSDLNQMKAQINAPLFQDENFTLSGRISVEKAMDYPIKFNATTSGKGRLKLSIDGYEKTRVSDEKIRPFKGVSPLDEAQWILHKRGAFKADEQIGK